MALDNPSYFTIPGGTTSTVPNRSGRFSLLRKHVRMGSGPSSASASSITTPKNKKNERYSILPSAANVSTSPITPVPETSPVSSLESGFKKSFRSLLRTTSFDDPIQTQMLVLGMPRPSDIAPSNHQFAHSSKKHHNRNASTGKSYNMLSNDPLSIPRSLKPSDSIISDSLLPIDERYYNIISGNNFIQSGRRHSIGAYFSRKNSSAAKKDNQIPDKNSFCDETAKVDFKFLRETPPVKKKNGEESGKNKCACIYASRDGKPEMEDIVVLSSTRSQAADLWVTYLKTCFDQIRKSRNKPPLRILSLGVEDTGSPGNSISNVEEKLKNAKLVIFIICPVFLEFVAQNSESSANVCKYVRPDGVLAMLLGIGESTITDEHKAALLNYSQWKRMESIKDRDEKFVGDFLGAAMDIISKNMSQTSQSNEKGAFMLMPKKVNKSQNKVLVLLNDPITKEDIMRVTMIRNNEVFEIPSVKKRNPYTLIFRMPEEFLAVSTLVTIRVEKNGADLGTKLLKCESQLYALIQILKSCDSPIEFMCQALNIVPCDKDKLDDYLVSAFQKNIPPNFSLLQTSPLSHLHKGVLYKEEYPTLLHFAARYGLEKLCWVLLECPGGEVACDIRNVSELTPAELAENAGHTKLANALCGYMQMTEFTSVYTFLKGISDDKNNSSKSDTSDDYLNPRPLSETYQVPPSPRPLTQTYSHPPVGYLQMRSPKSSQGSPNFGSQEAVNTAKNLGSSKEKLVHRKNSGDSLKYHEKTRENSGNGIQDELIEIINDFKNNVFTISEVERLVENWKNRNDVQQSFKEKQEQLNKMREEYERVQQKLKDGMKQVGRSSPMERIRNFFRSKNKEKTSNTPSEEMKTGQEETSSLHRPSSGLSIQSSMSSSSGRLSTGSHCSGASLGDSGTHSDAESERKFRSTPKCYRSLKTKDSLENYDIPPNPVCLFSNKTKQSNGISNYDIPPSSLLSETSLEWGTTSGDNESCPSCDLQSGEVNYYNLVTKDIPIPNQSTLHSRLVGTGNKNCLKISEEGAENKTEDTNCYEYINLPSVNSKETANCLVIENDVHIHVDEIIEPDIHLPDYVNVENSNAVPK